MATLESMAEDLRRLGDGFVPETSRRASPLVEAALRASAAAGTTPEGQAWAPKKSGGRAMPRAAQAVTAKPLPTVVRVILTGVEVFHHFGRGIAEVRRRIIPDTGTIPDIVAKALERAADAAFDRLVRGGR